ncbi:MAG: DUF4350 domain-containing protein [Coriobacteriia bacterium]|nr:DUF4350 domain-containing protein [Coriobacteriia bacterium]
MRWRLPRPDRTTVAVILVALAFAGMYAWLGSYITDYYQRTSPRPSVFSQSDRGLSIWYAYLDGLGLAPATLRTFDELPAGATLIIAGPLGENPGPGDAKRLARWVRDGGRLVLVSIEMQGLIDEFGTLPVPANAEATAAVRPTQPGVYTQGVRTTEAGIGRFGKGDPAWVGLFGDAQGRTLISQVFGRGEVLWLADAHSVSNAGIGKADNARLALLLASEGGRSIYFDEFHQGFKDEASIWDRLGYGGQAATVLILAGVVILVGGRARRLGPPIAVVEEPAARGGAYIGQLAELYRAAGARAEALEALEDGLTRALGRRYGTRATGLQRQPAAREALDASTTARLRGTIGRDEFLGLAEGLRRARNEVEGTHG